MLRASTHTYMVCLGSKGTGMPHFTEVRDTQVSCKPCESFWTDSQLVDGKCPDCGREVYDAHEEAYFFKTSKYADRLLKLYEENPQFALIDKYENFDKLTIAMLNEFIEKILVHERDRKGSIQTTQEVEIYFNFVGRFVPPAFGEAELTPEELEEIRKREERKDRLHQNYLKRKASGAQKRYEDKIKGRKKAEIEAKKAAIRAEDIAKGVFVPVSSLPQREPQKGTQIA